MAIKETIMSAEQKAQEQAIQEKGEKEFASKLAQSLDLPSTLSGAIDDHAKEQGKPVVEEEVTEEELESEESEQSEQEVQEEIEQSETEEQPQEEKESEDEDLIPKSKVQKRFDELTAEIKRLKADQARKTEEEELKKNQDSQLGQLEKMSSDELKTLKRQVRVEQIKAVSDEAKLSQLLDLEEKIDQTIQTAPQRFLRDQTVRFNDAVSRSASEIQDFDKHKTDIFNYAKSIFDSSPELRGSVSGQERAWKFAVDHFTALRKVSEGKSETNELKRQVNTLKKKISVDSPSKKTVVQQDSIAKLHKKAIFGDDNAKLQFIKKRMNTDSLVSDEEVSMIERSRR